MSKHSINDPYVKEPRSLFPEWMSRLTLQQQAVLMAAVRGQDGDNKNTKLKVIASHLRGCIMKCAARGRMLEAGEYSFSFMHLKNFFSAYNWQEAVEEALEDEGDGCYLHYYMHLAHAAQILSVCHPNGNFREHWKFCYNRMVDKLHLLPEPAETMLRRLGDVDRDKWDKEPENG